MQSKKDLQNLANTRAETAQLASDMAKDVLQLQKEIKKLVKERNTLKKSVSNIEATANLIDDWTKIQLDMQKVFTGFLLECDYSREEQEDYEYAFLESMHCVKKIAIFKNH